MVTFSRQVEWGDSDKDWPDGCCDMPVHGDDGVLQAVRRLGRVDDSHLPQFTQYPRRLRHEALMLPLYSPTARSVANCRASKDDLPGRTWTPPVCHAPTRRRTEEEIAPVHADCRRETSSLSLMDSAGRRPIACAHSK